MNHWAQFGFEACERNATPPIDPTGLGSIVDTIVNVSM